MALGSNFLHRYWFETGCSDRVLFLAMRTVFVLLYRCI